ncbi:MarR family winged helix-turn-helix transcriptional regulator [Desulfallas thermosapovorans]|uniref:DNA-binding MarR family transcriptional regulator n=1 Tax=Desulfallas thermosapovorans DSM 6562 TaxID=1121431 RepID=A0A5S4ZUW0_9FIRM|nr:MarR family transcriptional regulator [Desulfallas thermosapovorans]TYO96582.1 DNA-binding MarR family transcriptional regulator [Desulfallas thermosapovorans DSM 6562]
MNQEIMLRYIDRLEEMQGRFIRRIHQELVGMLDPSITGHQFVVLKMIKDGGQMTVSQVAEYLGVSLSAVTAMVDRLCKAGMLERRRSEEDRRVVWLEITGEGRRVVQLCDEGRRRIIMRYLELVTEEDLLHMIKIYERIIAFMRQEEAQQTPGKV